MRFALLQGAFSSLNLGMPVEVIAEEDGKQFVFCLNWCTRHLPRPLETNYDHCGMEAAGGVPALAARIPQQRPTKTFCLDTG